MNINDMTYGEIKEILNIFSKSKEDNLTDSVIGKYVIVRSRNEGLNAGFVVKADATGIILRDARRLWHSKPRDSNESWYEGISISGIDSDSKVSSTTIEKIIIEDYSVTICSDIATKSIQEIKSNGS